jgi:hypothetical protein
MFAFLRARGGLIAGDILTIALVTLAGFQTHGTLAAAGGRIWATFLPLLAAWLFIGAHVGVFDPARLGSPGQLWRPVWAMVLAAPLFGLIRAWLLGQPTITVVFVMVIGGVAALAMLVWRGIHLIWTRRGAAPLKSDG